MSDYTDSAIFFIQKHQLYFVLNTIFAFFIAFFGKTRPIGYFNSFILTVMLSAVLGGYITMLYGSFSKNDLTEAVEGQVE